jgi:acetyltransferase-like isoleucine patch superfamily enzyme
VDYSIVVYTAIDRNCKTKGHSLNESDAVNVRKVIDGLLELGSRRTILGHNGVDIHPTAKIAFRRIRLHPGCILRIGEGSIVEGGLVSERSGASLIVGRNTFIGNSLLASAESIEVGDDVLISWGCNIVDHNSHTIGWSGRKQDVKDWYHGKKDWSSVVIRPVKICDKSWIGLNVIILKGVEIGEGAVVAAGSVVTKSVPPWTIVGGNPARVLREITVEDR